MTPQVTIQKNGAYTVFEKTMSCGYYVVKLYDPTGQLKDKVVCDDFLAARSYQRAFDRVAKNGA